MGILCTILATLLKVAKYFKLKKKKKRLVNNQTAKIYLLS